LNKKGQGHWVGTKKFFAYIFIKSGSIYAKPIPRWMCVCMYVVY